MSPNPARKNRGKKRLLLTQFGSTGILIRRSSPQMGSKRGSFAHHLSALLCFSTQDSPVASRQTGPTCQTVGCITCTTFLLRGLLGGPAEALTNTSLPQINNPNGSVYACHLRYLPNSLPKKLFSTGDGEVVAG